jgi:CRP/FNR family cyclic AMP-dependent transcriptional regulator
MAIATASLDFDRFNRTKLSALTPEIAALEACPLLADAAPSATQSLAAAATMRSFARGAIVATEGMPAPAVVLVMRGRLRAVRRAPSGREITVEVFRPGDLLADAALAPSAPLTNDWEAAETTSVLMIPSAALLEHIRSQPEVMVALAAALLSRLERAKDLAVGLALSDVESRVVAVLVGLGRQDGADGPDGLVIRQRPTQQDIANQIGACRETVSRTVSDLVRRGLLTPRGRSLVLARSLYAGGA